MYLFCSEPCKSIFTKDYWLYTHLGKEEVISQIRSSNRVFITVGFGSECMSQVKGIAEKLGLNVVDLVEEAVQKIQDRKKIVRKKLKVVKGFQTPEMGDINHQYLEEVLDTMNQKKGEVRVKGIPSELLEVVEIIEGREEDSTGEEEEEEIFAGDKEEEDLLLERDDMEETQEQLEQEVFERLLRQEKSVVLIRSYLRPQEQRVLSREVEEIMESIGCLPDHLMAIYVDSADALLNLYDEKSLKKLITDNKEQIEVEKRKKLEMALQSAKKENVGSDVEIINIQGIDESESRTINKPIETELLELGINVEDVLGDISQILTLSTAKEKLKQNIIERVQNEFRRFTSFAEKLLEKQSLVVPLKMLENKFKEKNKLMILEKIRKVMKIQAQTVRVNGIGLAVSDSEGETAREKVIRLINEKQVVLGTRGLGNLFNENGRLKSEDFPVIHEKKIYFLEGVQEFWKLMENPQMIKGREIREECESLRVFLGGFDQTEKGRVGSFLEREFGLVRLTRQRVLKDVLFAVKFAGLLEDWGKGESEDKEGKDEEGEGGRDELQKYLESKSAHLRST